MARLSIIWRLDATGLGSSGVTYSSVPLERVQSIFHALRISNRLLLKNQSHFSSSPPYAHLYCCKLMHLGILECFQYVVDSSNKIKKTRIWCKIFFLQDKYRHISEGNLQWKWHVIWQTEMRWYFPPHKWGKCTNGPGLLSFLRLHSLAKARKESGGSGSELARELNSFSLHITGVSQVQPDYNDRYFKARSRKPPEILTQGSVIKVKVGETTIIPCKVRNKGEHSIRIYYLTLPVTVRHAQQIHWFWNFKQWPIWPCW